jgi:hypothetical protein
MLIRRSQRVLILIALLFAPALPAGAQQINWIRQFGTSASERALVLVSDQSDGAFVGGWTQGSLGGPYGGTLDVWIGRFTKTGETAWFAQLGSPESEWVKAMSSDRAGGVYLAGYTQGLLGATSFGGSDAWLVRLNGDGQQQWIRQFGTSAHDSATALFPTADGGVFVSGVTYDTGGGIWIARFDANGDQLWVSMLPALAWGDYHVMAPDAEGGFYIAGRTIGVVQGPNNGGSDAWIARHDATGVQLWVRQFGTSENEYLIALTSDGAGGVFAGGWTTGSLVTQNAGSSDAWIYRISPEGEVLWSRQFGTSGGDDVSTLAADGSGGVIAAGMTTGSLAAPYTGGLWDAWIGRFDSHGEQVWIRQFGAGGQDRAEALVMTPSGVLYLAGGTTGNLGGPNLGSWSSDAWIAQIVQSACPANCDGSTATPLLTIEDFTCFIQRFSDAVVASTSVQRISSANCDASTVVPVLNVDDFVCFVDQYARGCP